MTARAAVASADCTHETWTAQAQIIRETDVEDGPVVAMSIDLTMTCAACQAPMLWHGVKAGAQSVWEERSARPKDRQVLQPLVSPDQTMISIPCEPHPPGVRS